MSNETFSCKAKAFSNSGNIYSFGDSVETNNYCISIHTEGENIHIFIARDEYDVIDIMNGKFSDMFEQCKSFQEFKTYVLNEVMLTIKIREANNKFNEINLLGPVNLTSKGSQFLWKKGNSYIVTSWTIPPWGGPSEILGFESDRNGNIQSWLDLGKLCSIPDLIDNHKIVAEASFKRMW